MVTLALCVLALGGVAMLAGAYNAFQMASYISTPRGLFGNTPLWTKESYFTYPIGLKYRRNCICWFGLMALCFLIFALIIAPMPNFNL